MKKKLLILLPVLGILVMAWWVLSFIASVKQGRRESLRAAALLDVMELTQAGNHHQAQKVIVQWDPLMPPDNGDWLVMKGDVRASLNDFPGAAALYREALNVFGSGQDAQSPMARANTVLIERKLRAVEAGRMWTHEEVFSPLAEPPAPTPAPFMDTEEMPPAP